MDKFDKADALAKGIESLLAKLNTDLIEALDVFEFCNGDDWRDWKSHLPEANTHADALIRKIVLWDRFREKMEARTAGQKAGPRMVVFERARPKPILAVVRD